MEAITVEVFGTSSMTNIFDGGNIQKGFENDDIWGQKFENFEKSDFEALYTDLKSQDKPELIADSLSIDFL